MMPDIIQLTIRSFDRQQTHTHEYHQLVLPVSGWLELEVGREAERISGQRAAVIPSGALHRFRSDEANRFVVLDVPRLPEAASRAAARRPFFTLDPGLGGLLQFIGAEGTGGRFDLMVAHHAASLLLHRVMREFSTSEGRSRPIGRAVDFLYRNFASPISMEQLARAAGLSVSKLHEVFKREVGCGPGEFLIDLRLDQAINLLQVSDEPIAEIALAVGYSDQSALTRSMRLRRRQTPGEIRRASNQKVKP